MVTSGIIYHALRALKLPVDIRNICVLLAPACSGLTAFAAYLLTTELSPSPSAGLLAAIFMGIAPGYISRSVAGSYDNEAIAIFLLVFTFYLWIKAVKNGSIFWGALSALFYGYMVSAWGGYVFITNMIPLHAFALICMGRYSPRLYVSYNSWYALGTLASMQVPFVGFLPIRSSEHMAPLGKKAESAKFRKKLTLLRCIRTDPASRLRLFPPGSTTQQAVPDLTAEPCHLRLLRLSCVTGRLDLFRSGRAVERQVLLSMGYRICKDSHPYHRICLRASADRMASFLL